MSWQTGQTISLSDFRGLIFPYAGPTAPTGWLLCDGSAISRTTYAALFALIGTTYGVGDGSTTFNVPDLRGSMILGAGQRVRTASFNGNTDVNTSTEQITVASNNWLVTGQAVVLAGASLPTGLTAGTYYVIRIDATHVQLATTLANAQNGVAVNITAAGSGTCTLTQTLTNRAVGDQGGEEAHAMSSTEILNHTHTYLIGGGAGSPGVTNRSSTSSTQSVDPVGGNAAMNVMNPFTVMNYIIKT